MQIKKTKFFLKYAKNLSKKYRNIANDIKQFEMELKEKQNLGIHIGSSLFKIRVNNSDKNSGKSGGYRVISFFKKDDKFLGEISRGSGIGNLPISIFILTIFYQKDKIQKT